MTLSISETAVRSLSDLPSPRGLPLLGNVLAWDLPRLHLVFEAWAKEFGSAFTVRLGPKRVFVCSDADLLQTALRERPEGYRRFSPIESVLEEMNANGVGRGVASAASIGHAGTGVKKPERVFPCPERNHRAST